MKRRAMIAAGTLALALAGCQPETKAPEPVRPVLSMVLEPSRSNSQSPWALLNRGTRPTSRSASWDV